MPYLTYNEYLELGFEEMDESEFERLEKRASNVIDSITRNFYRFNSLEDDHIDWRRSEFKKAVATQIEYFHEVGASTTYGMNNEPSTVSIGRTSMSSNARSSQSMSTPHRLISPDVYMYLQSTGLLYTGFVVI